MRRSFLSFLPILALLTSACVGPVRFSNTSPEAFTREQLKGAPIRASVRVVDPNAASGSALGQDIRDFLVRESTFKAVEVGSSPNTGLVLSVRSRHKKTSTLDAVAQGVGRGLVNGVVSGLSFGIISGASSWKYDFWVELEGKLSCPNQPLHTYRARGSYEAELPDGASLSTKQGQVRAAVEQSYKHAFALLVAKLKSDRKPIENSGCVSMELTTRSDPAVSPLSVKP